MTPEVGMILEGKVTGITKFGAFVQLENGKTGLVHISEISNEYVTDIADHIQMNQTVKVKVVSIENEDKIALSIKRATPRPAPKPANASTTKKPANVHFTSTAADMASLSFEDKLLRFKQDSDERMQSLKRNTENRRGNSYKRSSGSY
ncbi:MAG: S1 RNA-binding domain-containing protein [Clostridia bacterium]|nr:S1 RNA-binding domain-containing protein [Clostridia bacterium]